MRPAHAVSLAVTATVLCVLPACGGPAPSTAASAAALDTCVVGSWVTLSITGALGTGSAPVQLAGGAGERLVIHADGSLSVDDSHIAPIEGTDVDGTTYRVAQAGSSTGRATTAAAHIVVTLTNPGGLSSTVYRNGVAVATQHPGAQTASYSCTRGARLTITSSGGTVSEFGPGT